MIAALLEQIPHPIELATEAWILERARAAGVDAAVVATALSRLELGRHCAQLRKDGELFVSTQAGSLVFDLANGTQATLTSDMLFELLLFAAPSEPRLVPLLCGALGLLPEGRGLLSQPPRTPSEIAGDAQLERLQPTTPQQRAINTFVDALVRQTR